MFWVKQMCGRTNYMLGSIVTEANKAPNSSTAAAAAVTAAATTITTTPTTATTTTTTTTDYYYTHLMATFPGQPWLAGNRKAEQFSIKCKSFAICSRQIITPAPHHSIFMGWLLFLPCK